jgi:hypothetical protein
LVIGGAIAIVVIMILAVFFYFASQHSDGGSTPHIPTGSQVVPTGAGSPSSSSVPSSVAPTIAVSAAPPSFVSGSPAAGYDTFLLHVPESLRASCVAGQSTDPSILFSTQCTSSDAIVVIYNQYADATSMDAAYQAVFAPQGIDAGSGSCEDHTTWPAESAYQVEDQPAGRRLCADVEGSPTIFWTDERLTIFSSATGSDPVRLVQFWTSEAGPIQ